MKVVIVDYGAGNVVSVSKALRHVGASVLLSEDPAVVRSADALVFPGQGHFGQAMDRLSASGMDRALLAAIDRGTPFLGICLGLQLLFEGSDEAPGVAGLGAIRGYCRRFDDNVNVPQIGWNAVDTIVTETPLDAVASGEYFYFVHSYHAVCDDLTALAASSEHGGRFCAAVARDNVFATQFHPEKSGTAGLKVLQEFVANAAAVA